MSVPTPKPFCTDCAGTAEHEMTCVYATVLARQICAEWFGSKTGAMYRFSRNTHKPGERFWIQLRSQARAALGNVADVNRDREVPRLTFLARFAEFHHARFFAERNLISAVAQALKHGVDVDRCVREGQFVLTAAADVTSLPHTPPRSMQQRAVKPSARTPRQERNDVGST